MKMSDEEYAEKFLQEHPPPEGVEASDWLRDNPPPQEESENPEDYWPVDGYGLKIPMDEWTVDDLGNFPDSQKDWLKKKLLETGKKAGAELLNRLAPSQIAQDPRAANHEMGQIVKEMGITPTYE